MKYGCMAAVLLAVFATSTDVQAASDADFSKQYGICMDRSNGSTGPMLDCIGAELERQDKKLNRYYKKAMAGLDENRKKKLREAQRAWIKMRDADCEVLFSGEGSISRINAGGHRLDLTADRAKFLQSLAEDE